MTSTGHHDQPGAADPVVGAAVTAVELEDVDSAVVAVMAHGMLNVLTMIQVSLHTLAKGLETAEPETLRDVIAVAQRNGDFLSEMLSDLVRFGPEGLHHVLTALDRGDEIPG